MHWLEDRIILFINKKQLRTFISVGFYFCTCIWALLKHTYIRWVMENIQLNIARARPMSMFVLHFRCFHIICLAILSADIWQENGLSLLGARRISIRERNATFSLRDEFQCWWGRRFPGRQRPFSATWQSSYRVLIDKQEWCLVNQGRSRTSVRDDGVQTQSLFGLFCSRRWICFGPWTNTSKHNITYISNIIF